MNDTEKLTWDDLTFAVNLPDSVWNSREKTAWAERAWGIIEEAQLTQYGTAVERAEVVVRFLALTGIFADFYEIAFADGFPPVYSDLAESLELSPIRVGQLVGRDAVYDEGQDAEELYHDALVYLANDERAKICGHLIAGFNHASQLFISLWRTNYFCDDEEADDIVDSDLTPNKMEAYSWITEGCYPYG